MKRRLIFFATVASFVLLPLVCGATVASLFGEFGVMLSRDVKTSRRYFSRGWVGVSVARCRVIYTRTIDAGEDDASFAGEQVASDRWRVGGLVNLYGDLDARPARFSWWNLVGVRFGDWHRPATNWSEVRQASASLLPVVPLCAVLPVVAARRAWARAVQRRHLRRGCCAACGFDLRASPGRCPECGTLPAAELPPARR